MDEVESKAVFARLVTLADTLVSGFDVVDLADDLVHSCLEFLPISAAGILLDDQQGHLRVLASSTEEIRVLELLELQHSEGPCYEAFMTGEPVEVTHLPDRAASWPTFAPAATDRGVVAVHALPLRLRDRTIGALNLFCGATTEMTPMQLQVAHAMASMATLGILNHWSVRRQEQLAEHLQVALDSRIVIEQAKGVIAERSSVDMGTAFELLRTAARGERRSLSGLATEVAQGRLSPASLFRSAGSGSGQTTERSRPDQ